MTEDLDPVRSGVNWNIELVGFDGWLGLAQFKLTLRLATADFDGPTLGDSTYSGLGGGAVEMRFGVDAQRGTAREQQSEAACDDEYCFHKKSEGTIPSLSHADAVAQMPSDFSHFVGLNTNAFKDIGVAGKSLSSCLEIFARAFGDVEHLRCGDVVGVADEW